MLVETQKRDVLDCAYVKSNKNSLFSLSLFVLSPTRNHVCHVPSFQRFNAGTEEKEEPRPQPVKR